MRNALAYVLNNARHHGALGHELYDMYASGGRFDGWKEQPKFKEGAWIPVTKARTWLMKLGWRKHRLISLLETPG